MNKISVVVPVYKVEKYLNQCVKSILSQTFTDFELILVDDGSPDSCPDMCDAWAEKDSRVKVIHKENGGLSSARNAGVAAAQAEYIAFVDSDDWVEQDFLKTLYEAAVVYGADMVQCNYQTVSQHETVPVMSPGFMLYEQDNMKNLLEEMAQTNVKHLYNSRWTKLYRADIAKEAVKLCPETQAMGEDYLMNFAAATMCDRIVILDSAPMYDYRINENSMSNSYSRRKRIQEYDFWNTVYNIAQNAGCSNLPDVEKRVQSAYVDAIYECCISDWSMADKKKEIKEILSLITDRKSLKKNTINTNLLKKICLWAVYLNLTAPVGYLLSAMFALRRKFRQT